MGTDGIELVPGRGYQARRDVSYTLPRGAFEGSGHWFVVELDFIIAFRHVPHALAPAVNGATTEVAVDANGQTCASILFTHVVSGGTIAIRRSAFGLVAGKQHVVTSHERQRVRFENFFSYHGVHGGRNRLTFRVNSGIGGLVRYVRILPDSGFRIQRAGPLDYRVRLQASRPAIHLGKAMLITAAVARVSGLHPASVTFALRYPRRALAVAGPAHVTVPWRRGMATFVLRGREIGSWPILVEADAGGITQSASTVVRVQQRARDNGFWTLLAVAVAGAMIVFGAGAFLMRRRRG